ncbi:MULTISPECIES: outer membrane lipoprotein-sorting protein [Dyadobacter]|uniref:Outer membrane lipoprotein-sorting protein n=1 Tax=Dyadobacter chenhuakuii TaxID=2909339 RepID=A0A9X1TT71_9BACT|nr:MULTISPECIES: outer membrane lipoprotein-sorting protein [Dyadobacter]MCF2491841.1 outer membrane lipoprotein-sorting protein [Dyadobacter chenhuakuii]MCF2498805.1 outer membrane lipoprotein-sorting protein [Dyadobacter chenhuakuii]MCF2516479.1 outer membrane lipoprotein-sorting protein [Dyadobacter sp. CY351]USJ28995.1 outer membrane lipoprotein-sorting protein [Dyadobacter chenhuakuii]
MLRSTFSKSLIAILMLGATHITFAQTVDEVIDKHIKAMGGADKLAKLQSVKIAAEMEVMNMKVPISTIIVQDKGFRSETTVQGMTVVQAINGNTGWTINPMAGQTTATALPEESVKAMSTETDLTGLYNYKQKGYTLTLDGEEDLAGAKVYKVSMALKNGTKRTNYISKDTFYILKMIVATTINGQEVTSENTQSDFRQVDGVTYPFTSEVTTSAMPGAAMVLKISSLEVNPKIDPTIFEMPKQ